MLIPRPLVVCARFRCEPLGVGIGEKPDLGVMGLLMLFNRCWCSCSCSVGAVWLRRSGLGPRGMFDVPRILDALFVCIVGKRVKLGDLDRVGDVARLGRGGSKGDLEDFQ